MKPCYECGADRQSNRKGRCKPCAKRAQQEYQRAYYADWKARNKEQWTDYQRRYYEENRERRIAAATERNRQNRNANNAAIRKWKAANRAKVAEYEGRRRARKMANGWEPIDSQKVFERDGWRCHLCDGPVTPREATLDHIVPISLGGPHFYSNVATAHRTCNVSRGARLLGRVNSPATLQLPATS